MPFSHTETPVEEKIQVDCKVSTLDPEAKTGYNPKISHIICFVPSSGGNWPQCGTAHDVHLCYQKLQAHHARISRRVDTIVSPEIGLFEQKKQHYFICYY